MSRPIDKDVFWVVLLSAVFWTGVWQHDWITRSLHRALTAFLSYRFW